jgi:hypothetical protein
VDDPPPYDFIAGGLKNGEVIPFFGAAASAVCRPKKDETWKPGSAFMPFGAELAVTLAKAASYTAAEKAYKKAIADLSSAVERINWHCEGDRDLMLSELSRVAEQGSQSALALVLNDYLGTPPDLAFVASWAQHVQGHRRAIEHKLREYFAVDAKPGPLQEMLAAIEATQLYVTTNYDDLLEKALAPRHPHVIIDRGEKGLRVVTSGGSPVPASSVGSDLDGLLNDPNTLRPSHPILFKMHGSVDKIDRQNDSYLITEEDYVDFLGRAGGGYIPTYISSLMEARDLLFLGYSLDDWNVRVILRKLLSRQVAGGVKFWAIVGGHSVVQQQVWQAHNLNIYPMDLVTFTDELAKYL